MGKKDSEFYEDEFMDFAEEDHGYERYDYEDYEEEDIIEDIDLMEVAYDELTEGLDVMDYDEWRNSGGDLGDILDYLGHG